jgi:uncharacterized protein YhbP (UPF0306 family)
MTKNRSPSWKTLIADCFASTTFMSLATYGKEGLWVNPVYFAWDKKNDIYFISELDCLHMRNIQNSSQVACTIYPTNQTGDVYGAYLKGHAYVLTDPVDKKIADDTYYGRVYPNDPNGKSRDADGYRLSPYWHFVKIGIDNLWYFDTRYFEERRIKVPVAEIHQ